MSKKTSLPVPSDAKVTHAEIQSRLAALEHSGFRSCLDHDFKTKWGEILGLIDRYQREVACASGMKMSCAKGCAACCGHWVEDVNSFEAELIAEHIVSNFPERIGQLLSQCLRDERELENINAIVEEKVRALPAGGARDGIDPIDLLLASFYRLRRPCPLLENGLCVVYSMRPLTCRMYVSFSTPSRCDPAHIDKGDTPTYLFDLEEDANGFIDRLHFRFLKFEGVTGLRPLLARYLARR